MRSSRPPSNARRVNSPGAAGRHPGTRASAASTALMTARPPCTCSSRTSSVVNERGAAYAREDLASGGWVAERTAEEDGERVVEEL